MSCTQLNDLNNIIEEAVWCTVSLRNSNKMLVVVIYCSPNFNSENNNA